MSVRVAVVTVALAAAVVSAVSASQAMRSQAAKPASVLAAVQGAWLMTSSNGQDMTGTGVEVVVTIKDNTYVQSANGQVVERGTFKLDETKKPMTIDLQIVEGDDAGQTQLGVLEVTGKTMTGNLAAPGVTARPKDLVQAEGTFTFTATKK